MGIVIAAWALLGQFFMQDRISDKEAKKEFDAKGIALTTTTVKINSVSMHYAKTGSDTMPTIVFVHGSPGSWSAFKRYLQDTDLLKHYRLIAIDRPGFGYSDFGETAGLSQQAAVVGALLHQIDNTKPIYLVGHSYGGPLIIKLAAENTTIIKGLVILSGAVDPGQEKKELWRPVLIYSPLRWLVPSVLRYSNEELWWLKKNLVKLKDDFPKVICPVTIMHGDKDVLVPYANAGYAQRRLINAASVKMVTLHNENHFIVWTQYEAIKTVLSTLQTPQ